MKEIATIFTSVLLCLTMLLVYPTQLVASAADNGKKYDAARLSHAACRLGSG